MSKHIFHLAQCDHQLPAGWYRFRDADMVFNQCLDDFRCGTHVPLWINGSKPSVR